MFNFKPHVIRHTNVFFWGCAHFGHDKPFLYESRGFASAQEHDEILFKRFCETVKPDSTVFLLGDSFFLRGAEERFMNFLKTAPFREIFIMPGNHFAGLQQIVEKHGFQFKIDGQDKYVKIVPNYYEIIVAGQSIVMSHYPIASWNGQGGGSWMLHAHVHGTLEKSELGKLLYQTKIKEVSVEKCPSPVSFSEVREEMDAKDAKTFDHHGKNTQNPF